MLHFCVHKHKNVQKCNQTQKYNIYHFPKAVTASIHIAHVCMLPVHVCMHARVYY